MRYSLSQATSENGFLESVKCKPVVIKGANCIVQVHKDHILDNSHAKKTLAAAQQLGTPWDRGACHTALNTARYHCSQKENTFKSLAGLKGRLGHHGTKRQFLERIEV